MDPDWRCMDPIEHGDIPASYVSLPEGTPHVLRRYLLHFSFLWVVFFFPDKCRVQHAGPWGIWNLGIGKQKTSKLSKLTCFSITNDLVFDPEILRRDDPNLTGILVMYDFPLGLNQWIVQGPPRTWDPLMVSGTHTSFPYLEPWNHPWLNQHRGESFHKATLVTKLSKCIDLFKPSPGIHEGWSVGEFCEVFTCLNRTSPLTFIWFQDSFFTCILTCQNVMILLMVQKSCTSS